MKLSVQNYGVSTVFGPEAGYRMIRECGFEAIDWNIDQGWNMKAVLAGQLEGSSIFEKSDEEVLAYYAEELEAIRKSGLTITQAHAPFPSDIRDVPDVEAYVVRIFQSCIRLCAAVGCPRLVIHGGSCRYSDPVTTAEEMWEKNMAMYTALIPLLRETGVMVCLENLFTTGAQLTEGNCSDPHEAVTLIDTLNDLAGQECFGLCLDTGHLNVLHKHVPTYVRMLGKRIKALHLHDNDAIHDQHWMPFAGCFHWAEFLDAMKEVGYSGDLNFETFMQIDASRMPPEYVPVFLKAIAGVGEVFRSKLLGE